MPTKYSDKEILQKLVDITKELGRVPTTREYNKRPGPVSSTFKRRLGGSFHDYAGYLQDNLSFNPFDATETTGISRSDLPPGTVSSEEYKRVLKALQKEKQKTDTVIQLDRSFINTLPQYPIANFDSSPGETGPESAVLVLSDIHYGQIVTPDDTNGIYTYNPEICRSRMIYLPKVIRKLLTIERKARSIEEVVIFLLGDLSEGENIYRGQAFSINLPAIQQSREVAELLSHVIGEISRFSKLVRVECVRGNHGRVSHIGTSHRLSNWDAVTYDYIDKRLEKFDNVAVNVYDCPIGCTEIQGKTFGFSHGSDLGAGSIRMDTAMDRAVHRWPSLLDRKLDAVLFGHFHTAASHKVGACHAFANGSLVGGNYFSTTRIRQSNPPSQWFFGVHPERVSWRYEIDFIDAAGAAEGSIALYD